MSENNKPNRDPLLLDHNYDGIQELNHPLPQWWLMIFYGTIVFSVIYVGYYMTGIGPSLRDELNLAMAKIEANRKETATAPPVAVEAKVLTNEETIAAGKKNYQSKCAACHGVNGEGGIGPNLTDDYWIHGQGRAEDLARLINDGVPDKGMPAWNQMLKPNEVIAITSFLLSLRGTHPPGEKAAQGTKVTKSE